MNIFGRERIFKGFRKSSPLYCLLVFKHNMVSSEMTSVIVGGIIGFVSSILTLIISNRVTENRSNLKTERTHEEKRIYEIYSPLIFIIDENRDFFAKFLAMKLSIDELLEEMNVEDEEKLHNLQNFLMFIFSERDYSKNIENLLYNRLGMFENNEIYLDIFLYASYLNTVQRYIIDTIQLKFKKFPKVVELISPTISVLEDASTNIKELAMSKTSKLSNYQYKLFFNEKLRNEIDTDLDKINMELFGTPVLDWDRIVRLMK